MKLKLLILLLCFCFVPYINAQTMIGGSRAMSGTLNYCPDVGSTDAYACNFTPAITAYKSGAIYSFKANTANTGAATIAFNGLGTKSIVKVAGGITTALSTNDIRVDQIVLLQYNGTDMQMQSTLGNASAGGGGDDATGIVVPGAATAAGLQTAIDSLPSGGTVVLKVNTTYALSTTGVTVAAGQNNLRLYFEAGASLTYSGTGCALTVGGNGGVTSHFTMDGAPKITLLSGAGAASCGIKLIRMSHYTLLQPTITTETAGGSYSGVTRSAILSDGGNNSAYFSAYGQIINPYIFGDFKYCYHQTHSTTQMDGNNRNQIIGGVCASGTVGSKYQVGTVSVTNGSTAIVGTGTTFTSGMNGFTFQAMRTDVAEQAAKPQNDIYTVTFVDSTHLTLNTNYLGTTNATAVYRLYDPAGPVGMYLEVGDTDKIIGTDFDSWAIGMKVAGHGNEILGAFEGNNGRDFEVVTGGNGNSFAGAYADNWKDSGTNTRRSAGSNGGANTSRDNGATLSGGITRVTGDDTASTSACLGFGSSPNAATDAIICRAGQGTLQFGTGTYLTNSLFQNSFGAAALSSFFAGDTIGRWFVTGGGSMGFSDGTTPDNANLYRSTANTIKTDGALVAAGGITLSNIASGTQCLHANSSGVVSGTGSDCGSGGGTPTAITVADTTDTTAFIAIFDSATGDLGPKTDGGITYNATTGQLTVTGVTSALTGNASTATALAANPADCSSNQFANAIAASGALTCAALVDADIPDTITASNYAPLASPVLTGIVTLPSAASPSTTSAGHIAVDLAAQGTGRDSIEFFDGTASTYLVGILASDTCTNGQVVKWNTGGTWTCEDGSSATAAGSDTYVQFNDGGTSFGGDAGLVYNKTTDALTVAGALAAASLAIGTSPPTISGGTAGAFANAEGTAPTTFVAADVDGCYADSTAHAYLCTFNNGAASQMARYVDKLSVFGATTSSELAGVISNETGSGLLVFGTSPTLTTPIIADLGFLSDANGNEMIIFDTTTSAVNEWTFANGSTGVNPKITASGETNVGLDFQVKGTGVYRLLATASGPVDLRLFEDTDNGTNYASIIAPSSMASNRVLTLFDATDTFVGKATTDTFTNKTFDTAGTGNSFSINGVAATANTGTGSVVRAADPTFTGIITLPTAATPTTDADGELGVDLDAWASGRDAIEFFDGTASTYIVGVLASDTPSNGQVLKWNTGGTITWETDSGGGVGCVTGGSATQVLTDDGATGCTSNAAMLYTGGVLTLGTAGSVVGQVAVKNATSGTITLSPPTGALGTVTVTIPAATDTLVGKATTDTFTNKTYDTAGSGNSFSINGVAATANTGTGSVVRAADPVITGSLAIPQGTGPTVDATGEIAVDTTTGQFKWYDGTAARVMPSVRHESFVIPAPATTDDINLMKAPWGMTIVGIDAIVQGTTSATGQLQECASDGTSCTDLDSDIVADADGAADDGTITDATIASGAWIRWKTTSVSGTPTFLTVTVRYRVIAD